MWASRFYGMDVPADVELREELTDRDVLDLVDAHLGINYSHYGAIDKTLAGFVVLSDEDDDYTLWDLRDTGQVFWQDHATRQVTLRHDSLAGYLAKAEAKGEKPSARAISTAALCARYQWLVWFLARPLTVDGVPTQSIDYLVRNGIGHFRSTWGSREAVELAFTAEAPSFGADPHLAIYWLLHATALADDELRARVLAWIGDADTDLVRAFVVRLGRLPISGDLPIVPEFRARRALGLTYGAHELTPDTVPVACLRALEASPHTSSLAHGLQAATAIDKGALDPGHAVARIVDTTPGVALVRAVVDRKRGAPSSPHADTLARLLVDSGEPWFLALEALWLVHELAYEGTALVAATRRIVARDRYHRRALQMAMRAASIAGQPVDEIDRDLAISDAISPAYARLVERPSEWESIAGSLMMPLRPAFAYRVLQRTQLFKPPPELALWAARQVLRNGEALIGEAFANLDDKTATALVAAASDEPAILLAFLDGPEPGPHDTLAIAALERGKRAALTALAPRIAEPIVFAKLMTLVERPARGGLLALIWSTLFSPQTAETYVLPLLDARQATRVARALVISSLEHPELAARAAASNALHHFDHKGAESFLIDALTEYGGRNAATRDPNRALEELVANIYASLRAINTPATRRALIERLFAERRAYHRMGRALADVWDAALHADILALLRERRDSRAAGAYAYTLRDHVQNKAALAKLADLITDWQGDTEVARGFLHYALVVGIDAALATGRDDIARRAHEATAWIAEPPLEPDHHIRGTGWVNPLEDPEVAAALQRALHPEEERITAEAPRGREDAERLLPKPKATKQAPTKPKATPDVPRRRGEAESGGTKAASKREGQRAASTPDAKAASKSKATPKAKPTAKTKASPRPKAKAKPTAKTKASPKAKAPPKTKATPKTKASSSTKATPMIKATPKTKAKRSR